MLLNSIASSADVFEILRSERIGVTSLTNSGSRDIIGHVTPCRQFSIGVFWNQAPSLTVSEIFNGESDAIVDMTLIAYNL